MDINVVASEEQVDVTSTDGSGLDEDTIKCSYCGCLKDGVLMFYCDDCHKWVHASCLHSGPPSALLGDNYYIFKCVNCTSDKEEFERMKLTWSQAVTLSLYNLTQSSLGKQGFFKWKEDICDFIDRHWDSFFHSDKKRTQWQPSVASVLSSGNPHRFQSGYTQFGETGWWRLVDPIKVPDFQPKALKPAISTPRTRGRGRTHFGTISRSTARKRQQQANLVLQAIESRAKQACIKETFNSRRGSDSHVSTSSVADLNSLPASPASTFSNDSKALTVKEAKVDPLLPLAAISDDENNFNDLSKDMWEDNFDDVLPVSNKQASNSKYVVYSETKSSTKPIRFMNLYDENKLLKKLLSLKSTENHVEARCLRRKLLLRQRKRELGIPVFNFDAMVQKLHTEEKGLPNLLNDIQNTAAPSFSSTEYRILDRFMMQDVNDGEVEDTTRSFRQKLIGSDEVGDVQHIVSPYTQRLLKPYIRRDYESRPLRLRLLEEIVAHYHKSDLEWQPDISAPIDYCYVRPCHIPTINAMCRHFFWPGVDLTESLRYPDFSVVALYKKMIIGFGFLVPDVAFNEAYISFLLVHPDWQHAGIGSFMLYHLVQTCMGKDLTLHVSASNPAMLLYQRFGFKPEQFQADFYDKYLPVDTHDCTHAFFMRLQR